MGIWDGSWSWVIHLGPGACLSPGVIAFCSPHSFSTWLDWLLHSRIGLGLSNTNWMFFLCQWDRSQALGHGSWIPALSHLSRSLGKASQKSILYSRREAQISLLCEQSMFREGKRQSVGDIFTDYLPQKCSCYNILIRLYHALIQTLPFLFILWWKPDYVTVIWMSLGHLYPFYVLYCCFLRSLIQSHGQLFYASITVLYFCLSIFDFVKLLICSFLWSGSFSLTSFWTYLKYHLCNEGFSDCCASNCPPNYVPCFSSSPYACHCVMHCHTGTTSSKLLCQMGLGNTDFFSDFRWVTQ